MPLQWIVEPSSYSFGRAMYINRVPALLPNDYCPDVHERLTLYKRLTNCDTEDDLGECRKS